MPEFLVTVCPPGAARRLGAQALDALVRRVVGAILIDTLDEVRLRRIENEGVRERWTCDRCGESFALRMFPFGSGARGRRTPAMLVHDNFHHSRDEGFTWTVTPEP